MFDNKLHPFISFSSTGRDQNVKQWLETWPNRMHPSDMTRRNLHVIDLHLAACVHEDNTAWRRKAPWYKPLWRNTTRTGWLPMLSDAAERDELVGGWRGEEGHAGGRLSRGSITRSSFYILFSVYLCTQVMLGTVRSPLRFLLVRGTSPFKP